MTYRRYRCFGPSWPFRYAYGVAYATSSDCCDEEEAKTWQEHREHRHRSRSRRYGSFGVRRPLRFLSYQLDLDESQRRKIAVALDAVKVEREQSTLDEKKMVGDLADLIARPDLSAESLNQALGARVRSTEQLQRSIARALKDIVEVLDPDQREEFAYLLRSGAFRI